MLSRDAILGAADLNIQHVEVPEWGGTVCLRALTLAEMQEVEAKQAATEGAELMALMVAYGLCDDAGQRLFTGDADVQALLAKNAQVIVRLSRACMAANRLTKKDVEELAGNSSAAPSGSTASPSQNG